jgi:folate-binding protein YgfZ
VKTGFYFQNLPRAALSVGGKDRGVFLHRLLSNDIKGLQPGQGKPACLLDRQGKILFSCTAHALAQEILLEMDPSSLPGARDALERYVVADAVQFSEATGRFRVVLAYGPAAMALKVSPPAGGFVARSPWVGMPGLDLWLPAEDIQAAQGFIETAQAAGMEEGNAQAFDVLRIEAGIPWPGREITPEVILNELGRDEEFVSFTKGCYVGQEIVARIKHRAHPPRLLAGFAMDGKEIPPVGSVIESESQEAGVITSACFSPTLGKPIALGFLKYGTEGENFLIQNLPARRAGLPFVSGSG